MNITPVNSNTNYNKQSFGMKFSPAAKKTLADWAKNGFIGLRETKLLEELGANKDDAILENISMGCINIPNKCKRLESNYYPEVTIKQNGTIDKIIEEHTMDQTITDKIYNLLRSLHNKYVGTQENLLKSIEKLPEA